MIAQTLHTLKTHFEDKCIKTIDADRGIFRCTRKFRDVPYQVLYVDCTDIWLKDGSSLKGLEEYMSRNLLNDYYDKPGELQWNFYYAFVTEREKIAKFVERRKDVEENEAYARKLVFPPDELDQWLTTIENAGKPSVTKMERDLSSVWIDKLQEAELGFVLSDIAYATAIEEYLRGKAPAEPDKDSLGKPSPDSVAKISSIKHLQWSHYRPYPADKRFDFGKVNLVTGANGSGKTSLLEAIELLLCGKTYRNPDAETKGISLKADIADNDTPMEFTSNARVCKDRDKIWFNNTVQGPSRLCVSFNKYIFYNADAAYSLSYNEEKSNVRKAFEDIALGEEVNRIESRMLGYFERFSTSFRTHTKLAAAHDTDFEREKDLLKQIASFDNDPEKFLDLLKDEARKLRWRPGDLQNQSLVPTLERGIVTAKSHMQSIRKALNWMSDISQSAVLMTLDEYNHHRTNITSLNQKLTASANNLKLTENRCSDLRSVLQLLKKASRYFDEPDIKRLDELSERVKEVKFQVNRLNKIRQLSGEMHRDELKTLSQNASLKSLADFLRKEILRRKKEIERLSHKREGLEERAERLSRIQSQIRASSKEFIRLHPKATECPVCHTVHSEGKLARLISQIEKGNRPAQSLDRLLVKLNSQKKKIDVLLSHQKVLAKMKEIATLLYGSNWNRKSISAILKELRRVPDLIRRESELLDHITTLKSSFDSKGLDEKEFANLTDRLAEWSLKIPNAKYFSKVVSKKKKDLSVYERRCQKMRTDIQEITQESNQLRQAVDLEGMDVELALSKRIEKLETARESFVQLAGFFQFDKDDKLSKNEMHVDTLGKLLGQYKAIRREKEEYKSRLKASRENIDRLEKQIKENRQRLDRAQKACHTIEGILKVNSKTDFLRDFITSNRDEIIAIFKMIHSPREFETLEFQEDGNIALKRYGVASIVPLSEISAGQRCALALSIFSALNRKLKNGPNLLMFDDPVSNIDDLNVLLYFDYLREIAIHGDRQIFFATADDNTAFFFTQKFKFLGDDFKTYALRR